MKIDEMRLEKVIIKKWEKFTGKKAVKLDGN